LTSEQYEYWKSYYKKEDNPMSEMAQFKVYIQETLEERINKMDDLGFDDEIIDQKIAQITFAFYNEQIIEWLRKRGEYI